MKINMAIAIFTILMLIGLASVTACSPATGGVPTLQLTASGSGWSPTDSSDGDGILMQDDGTDPVEGDGGDEAGGDDEDSGDESDDSEDSDEDAAPMSDVIAQPMAEPAVNTNLENALAGIADYEVSYDTTLSRADLTPRELRDLGVTYAGEESPVAARTQALENLDLLVVLSDRYEVVEEQYAADPTEDFAPEDPDRTLNYFQPREDPFVIPDQIPEELRPDLEGTGIDGTVDPELLERLRSAEYTANLRLIPIIIVGTIEVGQRRMAMYYIYGSNSVRTIEEGGSPQCIGWGASFSVYCQQVSEDFVVLRLTGYYDWRCRYPATSSVMRTFHVTR